MCKRTGYTAPCETADCDGVVTCRQLPQFCDDCWASFYTDADD